MKQRIFIIILAATLSILGVSACAAQAGTPAPSSAAASPANIAASPGNEARGNDQESSRKARALIEQGIQALGGQAYLNLHDMQQEGRTYSFHHGQPTSNGILFWRFLEYPDKERIEVTKQRDVAYLYVGDKGYEITFKGPHEVEKKDLEEYLRRRRLSLDTILRTWINDPTVALFYDGNALAGNLAALKVTLINGKNESVSIFFDIDSHLPIKKSYGWRDPVDKERNLEEEIFDNYRPLQGVMINWGFTRYFNGDMQTERFVSAVHINQNVNQAMFDPNSGYDPNKVAGKH
jgi:hypothetical protein